MKLTLNFNLQKVLLLVLVLIIAPLSYGNIGLNSSIPKKSFNLKYELNGKVFTNTYRESSEDEAIEVGAIECFNYFTNSKSKNTKVELEEDQALDLIDVCANPKKI